VERRLLFSKREAAEMLNLSPRTLEMWIALGKLQVRRIGKRRLIERKALEKFASRDHGLNEEAAPEDSRP
jgi:excisionase family DNA binding protein